MGGHAGRAGVRRAAVVSAIAVPVLAAALVWQSAYAGFTDPTPPPPVASSLSTGTLALHDYDQGLAELALPGLKPGDTATGCLVVTSTGSIPAAVRVYGTARTGTQNLASHLTITIDEGTGTSTSCADFTRQATSYSGSLAGFPTDWATGRGTWTTTGAVTGEHRTYRIVARANPSAPTSTKNGTATVRFVWETRATGGPR
jgi:hypothetical protein